MSTYFRLISPRWLGFLVILGLPTLASADAVPLKSGTKQVGTIKIIGDESGFRSVVVDNTSGTNVVGVKITFPKGVTASCNSCTKTTTGGQVTLNWTGANLGTDVNDPKKGNQTYLDYSNAKPPRDGTVSVTYGNGATLTATATTQVVKEKQSGTKVDKTDASRSIVFDSAAGTLTIDHDVFLPTAFPGDPLNGADFIVPVYQLVGLTPDGNFVEFQTAEQSQFYEALQGSDTLMWAAAPFLFYDIAQNQFEASFQLPKFAGMPANSPFFSDTLPNIPSQALTELAASLNPSNADFLPDVGFGTVFLPDGNFYAATNGVTSSADMGAIDYLMIVTPEPATVWLLIGGLCVSARWWKERQ